MRAKKKDKNQNKIEKELDELGVNWQDKTPYAKLGYDLEVHYGGFTFRIEIKNPEYVAKKNMSDLTRELTNNEKREFEYCLKAKIPYIVAVNTEQIIKGIGIWLYKAKQEYLFAIWKKVIDRYEKEKDS